MPCSKLVYTTCDGGFQAVCGVTLFNKYHLSPFWVQMHRSGDSASHSAHQHHHLSRACPAPPMCHTLIHYLFLKKQKKPPVKLSAWQYVIKWICQTLIWKIGPEDLPNTILKRGATPSPRPHKEKYTEHCDPNDLHPIYHPTNQCVHQGTDRQRNSACFQASAQVYPDSFETIWASGTPLCLSLWCRRTGNTDTYYHT